MSDPSAFTFNLPDTSGFQQKATITRFTPANGDTVTMPNTMGD